MKAKRRAEVQERSVTPTIREVELDAELVELLDLQRERFRRRFARDPGPNDPIFFDPNSPESDPVPITKERINQEIRRAFVAAGTPPELVYASEKTGFFPSEEGYRRMGPEDHAEWDAAIAEYFKLEKEAKTRQPH
jgi:hypothetical protein